MGLLYDNLLLERMLLPCHRSIHLEDDINQVMSPCYISLEPAPSHFPPIPLAVCSPSQPLLPTRYAAVKIRHLSTSDSARQSMNEYMYIEARQPQENCQSSGLADQPISLSHTSAMSGGKTGLTAQAGVVATIVS